MTQAEYTKRLYALMEEAGEYGLATVAVVIDYDPISRMEKSDILHQSAGPVAIGGVGVMLIDYAKSMFGGDR